jgi:hypothetical protein
MNANKAVQLHGREVSEDDLGVEDRLVQYEDGMWAWQARGSADVWLFADREAAVRDYEEECELAEVGIIDEGRP